MTRPGTVTVRAATSTDAAALAALGARTFIATYADDTPDEALRAHVQAHFGTQQQVRELADSALSYLVAEADGNLLGYAMSRAMPAPDVVRARAPLALARLYVDESAQGRGVGSALLSAVTTGARDAGHDLLWLTVWERNLRAITVYRRWGFSDVGSTAFDLGDERQVDRIMTLPVDSA